MISFSTNDYAGFADMYANMASYFLNPAYYQEVDTGHWQALKGTPHSHTREMRHVHLQSPINPTIGSLASWFQPNLPWAEDHFLERVGYEPLNPGEQYKNWPWYRGGVEDHKETGQFSHTYMERFWPRTAGEPGSFPIGGHRGIRYRYGDLKDVLDLLAREPMTRQAYLPIWFPEDTGAHHEQRVPCTLGYHFMVRNDRMHCFYPMRSVDFVRYLKDDLYMAARLVLHVIGMLQNRNNGYWDVVAPGTLEFFASSLHIFDGDVKKLRSEYGDKTF